MIKQKVLVLLPALVMYAFFYGRMFLSTTFFNSGKDIVRYSYPVRYYLWERLNTGEFPFWTERMFSGYPIFTDGESGYLNVINILLIYVLGPRLSLAALHLLTFCTGLLCFNALTKSLKIGTYGTIVASVGYFFSFFSLYHQQHLAITLSYYLFPSFIYLTGAFVETKKIRYLTMWSILFAFYFISGHFKCFY